MFVGINLSICLLDTLWMIDFLGCEMYWETHNTEFIWGKMIQSMLF